jgi:hypothetical protein
MQLKVVDEGRLLVIQVDPEFVEAKMRLLLPGKPTTSDPSAEQAIEIQFVDGALVCVQVWPDAVNTQQNTIATREEN